jgi:hypothetical protein
MAGQAKQKRDAERRRLETQESFVRFWNLRYPR